MPKKTPVEAITHNQEHRVNNPTQEMSAFIPQAKESQASYQYERPELYPRNAAADPQLVWRGKDQQDAGELDVPAVPIYIQEKVHPQVLIDGLRQNAARQEQLSLFSAFGDDDDFERKIEFYNHQTPWSNRMILGDSLLVMASLAEKEKLRGQVQAIYFDPPYGISFGSNWQVSTRKRNVTDGSLAEVTPQPEQIKAFRDTWALGVHTYLAYLRDRLTVARELLTPTGSIFVQIGDENVHLVRAVLDEVFGRECFMVTITIKKKGSQRSNYIDPVNDYILWYTKSPRDGDGGIKPKFRNIFEPRDYDKETLDEFRLVELPDGRHFPLSDVPGPDGVTDYRLRPKSLFSDFPGAKLFRPWPITNGGERPNQIQPVEFRGRKFKPSAGNCWRHTSKEEKKDVMTGMDRLVAANRILSSGKTLDYKRYLDDAPFKTISNWWDGLGGASKPIYVVQTNPEIIRRCLLMVTDPGDLVLDPTCGSGTTAIVAEELGRRWITIDTSRVAMALARTRLMNQVYPYFTLADSEEGQKKEAELTGQPVVLQPATGDIRRGFVYRRTPYITSSTIANAEEIDGIHEAWKPRVEAALTELRKAAGEAWEEWEVPQLVDANWSSAVKSKWEKWRTICRDRQAEINAAIARCAEMTMLYDQPYEDRSRVRVTGPFTVESLSPHRVLSTDDEERPAAEKPEQGSSDDFVRMILDNLRRAGVQNTHRDERIRFETLDPFAGEWIQAVGTYTDKGGSVRRVAVSLGPEYGTVAPQQVKEAAKEAVKGIGFDMLVVCGFAFDPHVGEEAKQFGSLTVLPARMNTDLHMGDDLKKTDAANLFMVFGEPDIDLRKQDGRWLVEIKGVDVYDPTRGEVRSSGPEEIACWLLDTDYNGESFFVRHAYFTGDNDPCGQLKRALRADIDEEGWKALYSTTSRPFDRPSTGKIAVKVINHYGDEVMKVFQAV